MSDFGYTVASYLTSGLEISELKDDGYYEVKNGDDFVYISEAALKELHDFYRLRNANADNSEESWVDGYGNPTDPPEYVSEYRRG